MEYNLLGVVDGRIRSDVPVILAADDLALGRLRHTEIENQRWLRTEAMFHYPKQYEKKKKGYLL